MKTPLILATMLTLGSPAFASPAQAQEAQTQEASPQNPPQAAARDWDVVRDPDKKLVVASTNFDNGLAIGARCLNNSFQVLIAGLPPANGNTRTLRISVRDEAFNDQLWLVAENPAVAISNMPSPLARDMREGGRLQIVVPGAAEGGRNLRYVLDLPASNAAVDEALQACGRPLVDPRDAELEALGDSGLPLDIEWARQPRPDYPSGPTYTRGFATVSCLTVPDGGVRDCVVETQHPIDGGFGKEVLESTRRARLRNRQGGPVPPGMISFRTIFSLDQSTTGSRIPPH